MTEDEAHAMLIAIHSPKLDALRVRIPAMRTSELLLLFSNEETLVDALDEDGPYDPRTGPPKFTQPREKFALVISAAMLALSEEIDRRIPVPPPIASHEKLRPLDEWPETGGRRIR